jgi:hypothetical protein
MNGQVIAKQVGRTDLHLELLHFTPKGKNLRHAGTVCKLNLISQS